MKMVMITRVVLEFDEELMLKDEFDFAESMIDGDIKISSPKMILEDMEGTVLLEESDVSEVINGFINTYMRKEAE